METEKDKKLMMVQPAAETRDPVKAVLQRKQTDDEKIELQQWTQGFFKRYDQALRNLAK